MRRALIRSLAAALLGLTSVVGGVQAATCNLPPPFGYGDPPATITHSLDGLLGLASFCAVELGQTMRWTDGNGTQRRACLLSPAGFSAKSNLPLLVWLHPSLFPQDSVILTGFLGQLSTADLTGDSARRGFQLLLVEGRDTTHFYPFPDNTGLGWDNWHRNFNRSSPGMNVDAATVDHFIAATKTLGGVDARRVYLSGWSNGAAFAQLYALNTPGIAAAAVYSSPDPYSDVNDPCAQAPFSTNPAALMDIHNACDIIGICTSGTAFHKKLGQLYPKIQQRPVVINEFLNEVPACNQSCASSSRLVSIGTLNHLRWPLNWDGRMFEFLRDHPAP